MGRLKPLALVLPGYNEELIIAATIRSAVAAGISKRDIYVVSDGSTDKTVREALKELPAANVLAVRHGGKAKAVRRAFRHFHITDRYRWVHIADADSIFCPRYFQIYRHGLAGGDWVAAVGFVQSMRGNWIAHYRCFSYTYGQHIIRRIQSWFGVIAVMPGPVTCFRTDIIALLDFETASLTEDFDLTLQIHRKRLGGIKFIPDAVNYTQDPRNLRDFYRQNLRWQRGLFQGVRKYQIGTRAHLIDLSVGYQISESILFFAQFFVLLPFIVFVRHNWLYAPVALALDFLVVCCLAVFSMFAARRPTVLLALAYY